MSLSVQFNHHHHHNVAIALCLLPNEHNNMNPTIIVITSQHYSISRYKKLKRKILKALPTST